MDGMDDEMTLMLSIKWKPVSEWKKKELGQFTFALVCLFVGVYPLSLSQPYNVCVLCVLCVFYRVFLIHFLAFFFWHFGKGLFVLSYFFLLGFETPREGSSSVTHNKGLARITSSK